MKGSDARRSTLAKIFSGGLGALSRQIEDSVGLLSCTFEVRADQRAELFPLVI
jgi:hypothetical protein